MLDLIVNTLMVWLGAAVGVAALIAHGRRVPLMSGLRRRLAIMTLISVTWMTVGWIALGLNLVADEYAFMSVWMRSGGITMVALVAAMGFNERRIR